IAVARRDRDARILWLAGSAEETVHKVECAAVRADAGVEIYPPRLLLRNSRHYRDARDAPVRERRKEDGGKGLHVTSVRDEIESLVDIHRGNGGQRTRVQAADLALELER